MARGRLAGAKTRPDPPLAFMGHRSRGATAMDKEQEKAAKARDAALSGALGQIERTFGKGAIMRVGDASFALSVQAIPTGALSLGLALGAGGMPRGPASRRA